MAKSTLDKNRRILALAFLFFSVFSTLIDIVLFWHVQTLKFLSKLWLNVKQGEALK
jgi:hypothetical protein